MNKKIILLISICVLVIAAGSGYLIVSSRNKSNFQPVTETESIIPQETVLGDLEYSDTSGFSFKYPKSLRVEDITPSDDSYYSKIALTKFGEKLTVTVKDETAKTVDEFLSSDDYYKNTVLSGATTLAEIPAKGYLLDGKLITIALKDGILYLVEGNKDAGFWEDTQTVVVSTFSFGLKSTGSSSSGDNNTTYEAEEVVE